MDDITRDNAKRAVVAVGEARGFIVEAARERLVVTAAHCLPHLPPAFAPSFTQERTYDQLLGRLADRKPKVRAECVFADPVADIAVLAAPDSQMFPDEYGAYEELTEEAPALGIVDAPEQGRGWLLTLEGRWVACVVGHYGGPIEISDATEPIMGGMSGSPILDSDGAAMGVVCCSSGSSDELQTGGFPNPKLTDRLPAYMLRGIAL